jgi:hypothetical protein
VPGVSDDVVHLDATDPVDPDQIAWQVNPRLRGPATRPVRFTRDAR